MVVVCGVGGARADLVDDSGAAFERASQLLYEGREVEAAEAFVAIAEQSPNSLFADDALFEAGRLYEERLGDPARALALYEELLERFPDSRAARAARRRADAVRAALGDDGAGAAALARFNEILRTYSSRPPRESIAMVEQLVDEYPDWAGMPRALMWLGATYQREGELARAEARYREVMERWPEHADAARARYAAGAVAVDRRAFDRAEGYFAGLPDGALRDDGLELVARERARWRWYLVSCGVVAAVVLALLGSLRLARGSWRETARGLWPPPTEVIYFAPIAAIMFAAALTGHEQVAPASAIILIVGLVVTWLSGAGVGAGASRGRVVVHVGLAAVGVAASCYVALHRTKLIDMILTTLEHGPQS